MAKIAKREFHTSENRIDVIPMNSLAKVLQFFGVAAAIVARSQFTGFKFAEDKTMLEAIAAEKAGTVTA